MTILIVAHFWQRYRIGKAIRNQRLGELFDSLKTVVECADVFQDTIRSNKGESHINLLSGIVNLYKFPRVLL